MSVRFAKPIDAATRYCAVYGWPVRHSASPAMQNAGMAALGLNWRYLACEVRPEDLRQAIDGARAMHFIGLNLTVPHKLIAMDLIQGMDESARTWGAVNTIRFEGKDGDGKWRPLAEVEGSPAEVRAWGFNTDAEAITRSLREDLGARLRGARAVVLGAGGAGRTAALKLASDGVAELYLINRTAERAEAVAAEVRARFPSVRIQLAYPPGEVDLLVNATSVGLKPGDALPFDAKRFSLAQAAAVFDMIYRPAETKLLSEAARVGCKVANGLGMLLYQGAKALEIWTGKPAPLEAMRQALRANVYGSNNPTPG